MDSQISPQYQPVNLRSKQGLICCGGCCDMRRAVLIINLVNLILSCIALLAFSSFYDQIQRDGNAAYVLPGIEQIPMGFIIFLYMVAIGAHAIGFMGALHFDNNFIVVAISFHGIKMVMALLTLQLPALIIEGLFVYPHVFLFKEIKENIMTPENYPNEKHSCCCV